MFKYILSRIRWGSLSPQQKEKLKTMSLRQVFNRPHLAPQLYNR